MARSFFTALAVFGALGGCAATDRAVMREAAAAECSRDGGYQFALLSAFYMGGCPPHLEADFLEGYVLGRRARSLEEDRRVAMASYSRELMDSEPHTIQSQTDYSRQPVDNRVQNGAMSGRDDDLLAARRRLKAIEGKLENVKRAAAVFVEARSEPAASGRQGAETIDLLASAHAFARAHPSVNHCTDEARGFSPRCALMEDAKIVDTASGDICVEGGGALKFLTTQLRQVAGHGPERVDIYGFYPAKDFAPKPEPSEVALLFDPDTGALLGVTCVNQRGDR